MSIATAFSDPARVEVHPFSRQRDGDEIVIGRADTGVFLALPAETVEILDDLSAGKTVGEARERYRQRHDETPDLSEFLEALAAKGFVTEAGGSGPGAAAVPSPAVPQMKKFHFENVPQWLARAMFSKAALLLYFAVIGSALWVGISDPSLVPGRSALIFDRFHTFKILGVVLFSVVTLFVHEMGHLLAARALGVGARLGIGHRLWILVAETDLTGLWSVPRRRRYLPLVAGPLLDLVSGSLIVLTLYADREGLLTLTPLAEEMIRAIFFAYFIQVFWQLFFFLRTDFYYVFANAFQCKSLMQDTENLLSNLVARWRRSQPPHDQSHIPPAERRVIRGYAVVWVLGRAAALVLFVTVTIPVTVAYFYKVYDALQAGFDADWVAFLDSLLLVTFSVVAYAAGMALWLRSLSRKWNLIQWRRA